MEVREQTAVETIVSADHVEIKYELAGIGSRAVAVFIDGVIRFAALALIYLGLFYVAGATYPATESASLWAMAVVVLIFFVVEWGYFTFFEAFWNGQTPGKRAVGIRVIRDGGYSITFEGSLIRNLLRIADWLPMFYGLGIVCAMLTPFQKRLGDMVAGTLVVKESGQPLQSFGRARAPAPNPSPALTPTFSLNLQDMELVQAFAARRFSLAPDIRRDLAANLLAHIRDHASLPDDIEATLDVRTAEDALLELLRRSREG